MVNKYTKAYKEVYELLKTLPEEDVNKIPQNMRDMFEQKMDRDYEFKVDVTRTFEEQNFSCETKAIIANIFRDYWSTPYQKARIIKYQNQQRILLDEEKKKKYNSKNIFENNKPEKVEKVVQTNLPIEYEKKSFYIKIIDFLKMLFHL